MDDIKRNDQEFENEITADAAAETENYSEAINPQPIEETSAQPEVQPDIQPNIQPMSPYADEQSGVVYNNEASETSQAPKPVFTEKVKKQKKPHKTLYAALGGGLAGGVIAIVLALALISTGALNFGYTKTSKNGTKKIYSSSGAAITNSSSGDAPSSADIIDKVGPAVVGIVCDFESQDWFWGSQTHQGNGSGVIINEDGYIVTNNHVIENATKITVNLISGESYEGKLIGTDSRTDLAVIKIEPKTELSYATFGDSSTLRVGDSVIAIGNPLGEEFAGSASKGIISATNRTLTISDKTLTVLQTDAAINPGNSGGALVNDRGEVIGINTAKISDSSVEGLGFSIPSNEFMPVIKDLMENGHVTGRPLIGISGREITEQISKTYGYPVGVYVVEVSPFSGAEDAGIKNKDVILEVNGEEVKTVQEINDIRDKFKAGDKIKMKVYRKSTDKTFEVEVTLGEDNGSSQTSAESGLYGEGNSKENNK
ncbi:MAG: trypsin-like peptidase domain-containing protein [Clostridia bacterium]|nr:trypsin-like peptidase domain-containing protein [Clostridia bacterium]